MSALPADNLSAMSTSRRLEPFGVSVFVIFCVGVPENPGATSCTDHGYIPLP